MLSIDIDGAGFGDGVRIMKPSGVGGDGPVSYCKNPKVTHMWYYLPSGWI